MISPPVFTFFSFLFCYFTIIYRGIISYIILYISIYPFVYGSVTRDRLVGRRGGEKRCALGPQVGIEPAVAAGRPVNVLVVLVGGATAPPDCVLVVGVCGRRGAGDRGSDRSEAARGSCRPSARGHIMGYEP